MKRLIALLLMVPLLLGARLFNDAATEYITNANAVVSGYPLTLVGWISTDDDAVASLMVQVGTSGTSDHSHQVVLSGGETNDPIRITSRTTSNGSAVTSTGTTINVWAHGAGVFNSATDRWAFVNGGSKVQNTTNLTPSGMNTTRIGASAQPSTYASGSIAEVAVWSVGLSDAEMVSLAKGASPLLVRPSALVSYWPVNGNASPEPDIVGGFNMTLNGTVKSAHTRIYHAD